VRARGQWFVGPDNGVLDWALADADAEVRSLEESRFFRPAVSRTFHGRDVFAPVAAHLACGARFEELGPIVRDPVRLPAHEPQRVGNELHGRVVFVDHFGNVLTNLTAESLERAFPGADEADFVIRAAGRSLRGIARSYGDAPIGTFVAIIGSSGRLELAEVSGHCASRWGLRMGDAVAVRIAR
jgi:S-adenosylmethionine hydrolase